MLKISELYIYPVKSLGGIQLKTAIVTDRGFQHDRRWMLVDQNNRFVSQREHAEMAMFIPSIKGEYLIITAPDNSFIEVPLKTNSQEFIEVAVWDDVCRAQLVGKVYDDWFSKHLNFEVRLVFMPDEVQRFTDPEYTEPGYITSFSDAYPFMMIGQASLDDLNQRLDKQLCINRFRPNIVFTGGKPYQEDIIDSFTVNKIRFSGVKLCARCNVITIDQSTAVSSKEPTKTLASYRLKKNKIYFGQNLIHQGAGIVSVGDKIDLLTEHTNERFIV